MRAEAYRLQPYIAASRPPIPPISPSLYRGSISLDYLFSLLTVVSRETLPASGRERQWTPPTPDGSLIPTALIEPHSSGALRIKSRPGGKLKFQILRALRTTTRGFQGRDMGNGVPFPRRSGGSSLDLWGGRVSDRDAPHPADHASRIRLDNFTLEVRFLTHDPLHVTVIDGVLEIGIFCQSTCRFLKHLLS